MRLARPAAVALLLLLAVAPAAGAHDGTEPNHRDRPSDLAAADINHTLAVAHLTRTLSPDLPQYLPTDWCGAGNPTSDDTAHAAFPATQRQIKVVYAYAHDDPTGNFDLWKHALQSDVSRIEQFLALQTGGRRALRFDMGTECGPQYLDIQSVALPRPRSAYIGGDYEDNFDAVAGDVHAAVGDSARDLFVLADGLTTPDPQATPDDQGVWGIAEVSPDSRATPDNLANGGGFTGMMLTPPGTNPNPWNWQPTVVLHEITHNLGGVQQTAPHHTSAWHCTDGEDVMCYRDGSPEEVNYDGNVCPMAGGVIPQTYDCGHNDYYNPDPAPGSYLATQWNVYDSAFMVSCTQLGTACGGDIVPTPPVNQAVPTVIGSPHRGTILTATLGSWLNVPSSYTIRWQRGANGTWADISGASALAYLVGPADVGAALRVAVTASNADGAAVVASAPTATVIDLAAAAPLTHRSRSVRIQLRNGARHLAGTLTAKVRNVAGGREVSTPSTKVSLPAGTWRLKLCAGRAGGSPRCTTTARVRSRKRGVRLPAAKVVVGTVGTLKVTAAALDAKRRVRARGQAASD